jgi:PAS domain S-box-containing protein
VLHSMLPKGIPLPSRSQLAELGDSALLNLLQRARHALRLRGPLANDPTAQILHTLLVGLLCWIGFNIALVTPLYAVHKPGSLAISSFAGLMFAAALALLSRGSFRNASLVYVWGVWLPATVTIIWNGGIHGVTMVFYIALPISAAWLLGYRAALVTAGVCMGSSLAMAVLEQNGLRLPHYTPGTPIATWTTILAAMIVAAVPVAQVLQILKKALAELGVTVEQLQMEADERRRAEVRMHESEGRFQNMADTAPVMIWVAGPDKLCTFFNKACLEFTGQTLEQKIGDGWMANVHPEDRERFLAGYSSSFDVRQEFQTVFRLRRADGEYRWVLTTGVPRLTPGGVFAGFIGSCVDITELKRTQEDALARQKLESLGVLAGGIAHDFNNLLGGILAEAELVETDLAAGSAAREEIHRIKAAAIRGAEIVRELMIYAGQDQGSLVKPVDLSCLAEEMLELLKVSISKQVVLKINLDQSLPAVWANAPQIRQVVMNLVINASEAIGNKEGVIHVSTSRVTGEPGSVVNNAPNLLTDDYVRLEVTDTGCGMTEEARAKIFDPFFSTKFAGRGMGLAVVRGIVRDHDGVLDVVSAPGQGTTFQVLLPCISKRALEIQNAITSPGAEQSSARTGTILFVEDEEMLRRAVSKALRKIGFSVMEASDGSIAMDVIRTHKDDLDAVLLDVTLPGMSSREFLEEARKMRPDLKVIVTTASSKETADASFAGLRVDRFIQKPFQLGDFARLLEITLSAKTSAVHAP